MKLKLVILFIICKNSYSMGEDNLSINLLKKCINFIIAPLTYIINYSLNEGIFPNILKIAKVIPIFKKGDNTLLENYRPISSYPRYPR